jgi:hypothetical protein
LIGFSHENPQLESLIEFAKLDAQNAWRWKAVSYSTLNEGKQAEQIAPTDEMRVLN